MTQMCALSLLFLLPPLFQCHTDQAVCLIGHEQRDIQHVIFFIVVSTALSSHFY